MRRLLPVILLTAVAAVAAAWLAAPRLIDQFGPHWSVTATTRPDAGADDVRAVDDCLDVLAPVRVVSDVESGRVAADFHAFEWEVRRVTKCLRALPGVEAVAAQQQ